MKATVVLPLNVRVTSKKVTLGLIIPILAVAACACPQATSPPPVRAAIEFVAEGTVDYHNFWAAEDIRAREHGISPIVSNTMTFTITVSNSCYLLRLAPPKENAFEYQEAGFDGQTLYFVIRLPPPGQKPASVHNELNVANAWIFDQQQVIYSLFAHHMGPAWLMLASGNYLRTIANGLVEPPVTIGLFENLDYYPRPFKIPARWSLQQAFPFLPLRVTCQDDGETKTEPPFRDMKRSPPFDAGFTNIIYQVTGTRKFDGVEVPCTADLDTYRPGGGGNLRLLHYNRYHLALTKWSKGIPPTNFRPKLPGLATISDTRAYAANRSGSLLATEWPMEEKAFSSGGRASESRRE